MYYVIYLANTYTYYILLYFGNIGVNTMTILKFAALFKKKLIKCINCNIGFLINTLTKSLLPYKL